MKSLPGKGDLRCSSRNSTLEIEIEFDGEGGLGFSGNSGSEEKVEESSEAESAPGGIIRKKGRVSKIFTLEIVRRKGFFLLSSTLFSPLLVEEETGE